MNHKPDKAIVLRLKKPPSIGKIPKGVDSPVEVIIWLCCAYASWGLSNRVIRSQLGLSDHQIYKILKPFGIKRKHYRDAMRIDLEISKKYPTQGGRIAIELLGRLDYWSERKLIEHMEKHLLR
jgi:hypothetical protein